MKDKNMRKLLFPLLLLVGVLDVSVARALPADDKDKASDFFVRAVPDRSEVIAGDSLLVSYVVYAAAPIASLESNDEPKVRNGRLRRLPVRREATSSRVMENGRVYYTLVWSQYVVAPKGVGEVTLSPCEFKGTLHVYPAPRDPFEAFFGTNEPPRKVKVKAHSEKLQISVKPKPKRSNSDLSRGGGFV